MEDIANLIRTFDGMTTVAVLVFFGLRLNEQMAKLQENQQNIIMTLIDLMKERSEDK